MTTTNPHAVTDLETPIRSLKQGISVLLEIAEGRNDPGLMFVAEGLNDHINHLESLWKSVLAS